MRGISKTLALISLLLLSACSVNYAVTPQNPAAGFPYRHSDFDYKVAWKTSEAGNAVVIDGILKNVRYEYISSLDLTVFLVGANGKVRARTTTSPFPQQSQMDAVVPFAVKLPDVSLQKGDTFKFAIHYTGSDGGPGSGVDLNSAFAVDAMTGAAWHRDNLKSEEW